MYLTITLRDLISAVEEFAETENEIMATVVHLISSGRVRLLRGGSDGPFDQLPELFA